MTGSPLHYLRLKPGGMSVEPLPGYKFVTCGCGCTHWICVVRTATPSKEGKPPVTAFICRNCLFVLDKETGS
jgi:hypothetical protein